MKGFSKFAGIIVFAAALLGLASSAKAQVTTTTTLPPTWKVNVTASAATKAAGRPDFIEYIFIDAASFSGEQICKLGMVQTGLTVSAGATGSYNVTCSMHSNTQGDISFSGTVSNTVMTGTLTWTIGGVAYTYTYNGVPFTPDPNAES